MSRTKEMRDEFPTLMARAYETMRKHHFVEEIMSRNVVTIRPDANIEQAAKIMGEKHIGSLLVLDEGKVIGIVTERDLLSKVLAKGKEPASVLVKDVMSYPVVSVRPSITIKEAAAKMIAEKGRLVVMADDRVVGIITASDLIKSLPESPETELKVEKVMTRHVKSVDESTTVAEVAKIMGDQRIGSVIVNRNGKPYGIFTERDLLTTFLAAGKSLQTKVGEAASHPLITIPIGTSIHQTAMLMSARHIRRLPVVEKDKIVGIVTARDLVEAYAK
ncbi:MAG: CBS domain-containing protein [Candidatus Bathyarchaeia archaeon]